MDRELRAALLRGLEEAGLDAAAAAGAAGRVEAWLGDPATAWARPTVEGLLAAGRWAVLADGFHRDLPFGTGGCRGPVGVGPNRFNPTTLGRLVAGHARWLRERHGEEPTVVVAYDVRVFEDGRGEAPPGLEHPLAGWTSRRFAELAARIYARSGVDVWLPPAGGRHLSTPELSFAIRELGASGGLNISASHNPPDDNGAKVYDHRGAQPVPPRDAELAAIVAEVEPAVAMDWEEARAAGRIRDLPERVHRRYLDVNLARSRHPAWRGIHVVFTPLHGTGGGTVGELLAEAGFRVTLEPAQSRPDGRFPTVPHANPNPENPRALDRAVALAQQVGADLVMACDPDADRLGLAVRHGDAFRAMTGNEMGALLVRYLLAYHRSRTGRAPLVLKTEVTSRLVSRVAVAHGARVVGHLLVGFKYIAEALRQLEAVGSFCNVEASLDDFLAGVEESHGLLVTPEIRDKDAAGAALLLAEAAAWQARSGRTLVDLLAAIWDEVGYVHNLLRSIVMRGAVGLSRIRAVQASLRDHPPRWIGEAEVTAVHDRLDPRGPFGRVRSATAAAARDVLVFELGPDARVVVRPSGTEPKTKIYVEVAGPPHAASEPERRRIADRAEAIALAFLREMLGRIGFDLPAWALEVSDLVPLEARRLWAEELLPGLVRSLEAGEAPGPEGLARRLAPLGPGARELVAPSVSAWLAGPGSEAPEAVRAGLAELFGVG